MPPARSLRDVPRIRILLALGVATLIALLARLAWRDFGGDSGFHGHGWCYLWDPALVAAHVTSDALIGISYMAISLTLVHLVRRTRQGLPFSWIFVAFGAFIIACGATHLVEIWTLWTPMFWLSADIKIITAIASVTTAAVLPPLVPKVLQLIEQARLSEDRRRALERAHEELERRVAERTAALHESLTREQRLREAAETANRAKEEFLATVSHELRTPLNAILGWSDLLQRPDLESAATSRALGAISRNARAQAQVIDDLLDVSRITSGKLALTLQPTDLAQVVRAAVDVVRPAASGKHLTIECQLPPEPVIVNADASRLQQVAWNLLSNAVKFTPDGGAVGVRVSAGDGRARLDVRDNGIGISASFLPHLFDRFTQADSSTTRRYSGLGLGLSIAKHLVELHGGTISAASDGPGFGTTFSIALPVLTTTPPRVAESHAAATRVRSDALAGHTVLVVDDDGESREVVSAILEAAGGEVVAAASADEGLQVLAERRVQAVVCDVGMPEKDGYAFVRALRSDTREHVRRLPVVALTGYAGQIDEERVLQAGFDQHLAKPVTPATLVARLEGLLRAGR
jgi:signal transduction histidine kinase